MRGFWTFKNVFVALAVLACLMLGPVAVSAEAPDVEIAAVDHTDDMVLGVAPAPAEAERSCLSAVAPDETQGYFVATVRHLPSGGAAADLAHSGKRLPTAI